MSQRQEDAPSRDPGKPDVLLPLPFRGDPTVDDALSTIMQWLYAKIPSTR